MDRILQLIASTDDSPECLYPAYFEICELLQVEPNVGPSTVPDVFTTVQRERFWEFVFACRLLPLTPEECFSEEEVTDFLACYPLQLTADIRQRGRNILRTLRNGTHFAVSTTVSANRNLLVAVPPDASPGILQASHPTVSNVSSSSTSNQIDLQTIQCNDAAESYMPFLQQLDFSDLQRLDLQENVLSLPCVASTSQNLLADVPPPIFQAQCAELSMDLHNIDVTTSFLSSSQMECVISSESFSISMPEFSDLQRGDLQGSILNLPCVASTSQNLLADVPPPIFQAPCLPVSNFSPISICDEVTAGNVFMGFSPLDQQRGESISFDIGNSQLAAENRNAELPVDLHNVDVATSFLTASQLESVISAENFDISQINLPAEMQMDEPVPEMELSERLGHPVLPDAVHPLGDGSANLHVDVEQRMDEPVPEVELTESQRQILLLGGVQYGGGGGDSRDFIIRRNFERPYPDSIT